MMDKRTLVQHALTTALRLRQKAGVRLTDSLCIYDFAEANGVAEVRFVDIPSLEEFYWKNARMILVSSLRPAGRQAYNCAHGFGHHVFGHGECIAAVPSEEAEMRRRIDPNEFLVDCFAAFLLMPSTTVSHAFTSRGWQPKACTPVQVFTVAGSLGVGYATLIQHMRDVLKLISHSHAETLFKTKPKQIRAQLIGNQTSANVVVADVHWTGRPIDLEVGDLILLPPGAQFGGCSLELVENRATGTILRGVAPGEAARVTLDGWAAFVRVSRRGYVGRNIFRHLEDPDYVRD